MAVMMSLAAAGVPHALASHGIYKDFVIWSNNGGANQYFHGGAGSSGTAWGGANLGTYDLSGNLKLQGAEINTFDGGGSCGGNDLVYAADFFYCVYKQGATVPSLTGIGMGFRARPTDGSNNNEKWDQTTQNIDLIAAAAATGGGQGTYNVAVYFRASDSFNCTGTFNDFDNNGGNNWIATFVFNPPAISTSGTLAAVTTTYGAASATPTSFTVSGTNMSAGITVMPPTGFEVSQSAGGTSGYAGSGTSITVGTAGTIASTTVYVRLAATATVAGTYNSQNIVLSSTGASSVNIATAASGNTVNKQTPIVASAPSATSLTYGQTLASSTLSGGSMTNAAGASVAGNFAFTTSSTAPNAGTTAQSVTFTPTDSTNYNSATTAASVTVDKAVTALVVSSTLNPAGYRSAISFSATLTPAGAGNLVFKTNSVVFDTVGLSSGSATSGTTTNLPRGNNTITVEYTGDSNYKASTNTLAGGQVVTNHPPTSTVMTVTRTAGLPLMIALSEIATNWSDDDGDSVTLAGINLVTTNGIYLATNNAWILYTNSPNVNDQISYSLSDGQGGTNIGYVNILVNTSITGTNSIASIVSGNPTTLTAYGIPFYSYITERSSNLTSWVSIATNAAAANGVITVLDNFADLGGTPPSTAYYRLKWHP